MIFKNASADVHSSITFRGMCKECGAAIVAKTNVSNTTLTVDIKNYNADYVHSERRHLKGAARENIAARLKGKSAFKVHRELVDELIVPKDDRVPPQLPQLATSKNLKGEATTEGESEIETNVQWKNSSVAYRNTIFDVAISPFFVNYHLPIHREFYLAGSRHNKIAISADCRHHQTTIKFWNFDKEPKTKTCISIQSHAEDERCKYTDFSNDLPKTHCTIHQLLAWRMF